MNFYSTKSREQVNLKQAVLKGLANDGGLYMPETIPVLPSSFIQQLSTYSLPEIGFQVAKNILGNDVPDKVLQPMIEEVLNFPIPLVCVENNIYSLELFHGPTCAFKDIGARFMARLMSYFAEQPLKVIVATSGDTGSAVAAGFFNVPNIEVYILYPKGKVSPLQEKQLTTWGGNITAIEIEGSFDDCQALAKQLLADKTLNQKYNLTSANSINIARLIPQSFYYFWGYAQLTKELQQQVVYSVPSGNFGNLTAGIFAQKMGLPINHFIASTNINDIVPQYLQQGVYSPKPSKQTISNAMDVGNPSNFERMKDIFGDAVEQFRQYLSGYSFTDITTKETMLSVYQNHHYMLDPHGAVAYLGLKKYLETHTASAAILLETAHPAKFLETVEPTLNTTVKIPDTLAKFIHKEKQSIVCPVILEEVKKLIK